MTVLLSHERIEQAKALRQSGVPWEEICDRLGCSKYTLKSVLVEGWRKARTARVRHNRRLKRGGYAPRPPLQKSHVVDDYQRPRIPPETLADRDRRAQLAHRDLTAVLMGDPPPGMSALDRKRGV